MTVLAAGGRLLAGLTGQQLGVVGFAGNKIYHSRAAHLELFISLPPAFSRSVDGRGLGKFIRTQTDSDQYY